MLLYVDGVNGNDANGGFTPETALRTIQKATQAATDYYTIVVYPGVYNEEVYFRRKRITITGQGNDATVIEAPTYAVSFVNGEGRDSVLRNVVIRGCGIAGIVISGASPTITNVTVVDNQAGIKKYSWGEPDISNSIFWDNTDNDIEGCEMCSIRYSCVQRGAPGEGNISDAPLFADASGGDYHLRSERGRYRATTDEWILDEVTSPCVDAGEPWIRPAEERMPNGGRLNMGAFGGTYYASMSEWKIVGDINYDGVVNIKDFAIIADNWLGTYPI